MLAFIFAGAVCASALVLWHLWPFSEGAVRARLAQATSTTVRFRTFHAKYFPFGCVAEGVSLQGSDAAHTVISIDRLTITSNPLAMLRRHVSQLRAERVQASIDRADAAMFHSKSSQTVIDDFVADDAVLQVGQRGSQPFRMVFQSLKVQNLAGEGPSRFWAVFQNPKPAGVVKISGAFNTWNRSDPSLSGVFGQYSLENADLAVFHSLTGKISSTGHFAGTLKALDVEGSTNSPEFELTDTHHHLPLHTVFRVRVDATAGDVLIRALKASFGRDELDVQGSVARGQDGKRVALIDINCASGRIEDTFYPFIHSPKSPIAGDVVFRMHVTIPGGGERFLKRVEMESTYRISNAQFTNPQTELRLKKVSDDKHSDDKHSDDKHTDDKHSDDKHSDSAATLDGGVLLQAGIAHFSVLSVKDEGASAQLHGMYNLVDDRVNLHGQLTTTASLAKTTSGVKAVFARVLEPLIKKRHHEKIVPVKITGSFHHPNFGLDISSRM